MKSISTIIALFICVAVSAQLQNPVSWIFSAKKLGNKMYEVHLTASISGKYHMYAQKAKGDPEDLVPTSISFIRNPLLTLQGPVKELGKKITKYEKVWEAKVNYFENTVDFVQLVKSKVAVPASLKGTVEFMVCDDKQCLPPKTVAFDIKLGN